MAVLHCKSNTNGTTQLPGYCFLSKASSNSFFSHPISFSTLPVHPFLFLPSYQPPLHRFGWSLKIYDLTFCRRTPWKRHLRALQLSQKCAGPNAWLNSFLFHIGQQFPLNMHWTFDWSEPGGFLFRQLHKDEKHTFPECFPKRATREYCSRNRFFVVWFLSTFSR